MLPMEGCPLSGKIRPGCVLGDTLADDLSDLTAVSTSVPGELMLESI